MFTEAYFDESGIHDHAQMCVVGGYYGVESAWRKFEPQWKKILKDHGLLDVGFHAKVFYRREDGKRVPPYADWADVRAEEFENRLIQAIMRSRIFPFGHGSAVAEWDALPYGMRKFLSGAHRRNGKFLSTGSPDKSYYLPFQFCVSDAVCNSGARDKVHMFAGIDRTFSKYAEILYSQLRDDPRLSDEIRDHMGTLAFPLAKETPALQACDLLVYQLYRFQLARLKGPARKRPILTSLLKNRRPAQRFNLFKTSDFYGLVKLAEDRSAVHISTGYLL
jgi:hypothetical protein